MDEYCCVLDVEPANEEARRRLEGWLGDDALKLTVATILLPVYERLQFWPQMVQALEIQVAAAQSSASASSCYCRSAGSRPRRSATPRPRSTPTAARSSRTRTT